MHLRGTMNLMLPLMFAMLAMSNANAQQPSYSGHIESEGLQRRRLGGVHPQLPSGVQPQRPSGVQPQRPSGVQPQRRSGVQPQRPSGVQPQQRNADGTDLTPIINQVFQPGPVWDYGDDSVSGGGGFTKKYTAENGGATGDCQCVTYYFCSNSSKFITDGIGLIDIRRKNDPCDNYMDVCCKKPQILNPEPEGGFDYEDPDGHGHVSLITPAPIARTGCGQRNPGGVGFRITGDTNGETQHGEFPWMVALIRQDPIAESDLKLNVYVCGGSLINLQVVLTAAHCVAQKSLHELRIRAGEWDTQNSKELFPHQDRDVSQIVMHEAYYAGALYNDIALLILEHPVDPAENIDTVCLPRQGESMDHRHCIASGWGKSDFGNEGKHQVILKKVELPIVPHPKCETALRRTRLGPRFQLHHSFICAGGEPDKDTCKGDGGSPLVCPYPDDAHHYTQAGIVAWGIGCGENQNPGVYVNVAHFRDWIDEKMSHHPHLDSSSYTRPY